MIEDDGELRSVSRTAGTHAFPRLERKDTGAVMDICPVNLPVNIFPCRGTEDPFGERAHAGILLCFFDQFPQDFRSDVAFVLGMVLDKVKHPADLLFREFAAERCHNVFERFFPGMFPEDEMPLAAHEIRREILVG